MLLGFNSGTQSIFFRPQHSFMSRIDKLKIYFHSFLSLILLSYYSKTELLRLLHSPSGLEVCCLVTGYKCCSELECSSLTEVLSWWNHKNPSTLLDNKHGHGIMDKIKKLIHKQLKITSCSFMFNVTESVNSLNQFSFRCTFHRSFDHNFGGNNRRFQWQKKWTSVSISIFSWTC